MQGVAVGDVFSGFVSVGAIDVFGAAGDADGGETVEVFCLKGIGEFGAELVAHPFAVETTKATGGSRDVFQTRHEVVFHRGIGLNGFDIGNFLFASVVEGRQSEPVFAERIEDGGGELILQKLTAGAGIAQPTEVAEFVVERESVAQRSDREGCHGGFEADVLLVVATFDGASREEGVAVVAAKHVTPGAIFDAGGVEVEATVGVKSAADVLIAFGEESQSITLAAFLDAMEIAGAMTEVEERLSAVGHRICREPCGVEGVVPKLPNIVEAITTFGGQIGLRQQGGGGAKEGKEEKKFRGHSGEF